MAGETDPRVAVSSTLGADVVTIIITTIKKSYYCRSIVTQMKENPACYLCIGYELLKEDITELRLKNKTPFNDVKKKPPIDNINTSPEFTFLQSLKAQTITRSSHVGYNCIRRKQHLMNCA